MLTMLQTNDIVSWKNTSDNATFKCQHSPVWLAFTYTTKKVVPCHGVSRLQGTVRHVYNEELMKKQAVLCHTNTLSLPVLTHQLSKECTY